MPKIIETTIEHAVDSFYTASMDLYCECEEVVDNASGTPREGSAFIEAMSENMNVLDTGVSIDNVPNEYHDVKISVTVPHAAKTLSRGKRMENALAFLNAVITELEKQVEKFKDNDEGDGEETLEQLNNVIEEFQRAADDVYGTEWPSAFGG